MQRVRMSYHVKSGGEQLARVKVDGVEKFADDCPEQMRRVIYSQLSSAISPEREHTKLRREQNR